MIEQAIYKLLTEDATVRDIVATRVYAQTAPQGRALPFITYTRVSGMHYHDMTGIEGLANVRVQVDCWSDKYAQVKQLAERVRLALDGHQGDVGTFDVRSVLLESDNDAFVSPFRGEDTGVHRQSMDFQVVAVEATS